MLRGFIMAFENHNLPMERVMSRRPVAPEFDNIAWSLAALIAGGGLVAAVLYLTAIPLGELLTYALTFLLPIAALGLGLGLIGTGTWVTLKSLVSGRGQFGTRVKHWVETLERDPNARPDDPWAAQA